VSSGKRDPLRQSTRSFAADVLCFGAAVARHGDRESREIDEADLTELSAGEGENARLCASFRLHFKEQIGILYDNND